MKTLNTIIIATIITLSFASSAYAGDWVTEHDAKAGWSYAGTINSDKIKLTFFCDAGEGIKGCFVAMNHDREMCSEERSILVTVIANNKSKPLEAYCDGPSLFFYVDEYKYLVHVFMNYSAVTFEVYGTDYDDYATHFSLKGSTAAIGKAFKDYEVIENIYARNNPEPVTEQTVNYKGLI